ncbi:MAG: formylglycine-generating enzyme family protein [Planctomycetes bacterium]|nr:formylglycine-generating enzyme family protein [Planctomycetota bacterium]
MKIHGMAMFAFGGAWWMLATASPSTQPATQPSTQPSTQPAKELTLDLGNKITMKLVLIPAGKFMMGSLESEKERNNDEGPQHEVAISKPFYMGVNEVTQEQYQQLIGKNTSDFKGPSNPADNVSWDETVEFCNKLFQKTGMSVKLPTEAQWEYACRAGSKTRFGFGDEDDKLDDYAWYGKNSGNKTHPVGQKQANAWGLYDIHGNVWEWCLDLWTDSYENAKNEDPEGSDKTYHVLRSGSWANSAGSSRSACRIRYSTDDRYQNVGFRVVVELK